MESDSKQEQHKIPWKHRDLVSIWKGIVLWGNRKCLLIQSKQQYLY